MKRERFNPTPHGTGHLSRWQRILIWLLYRQLRRPKNFDQRARLRWLAETLRPIIFAIDVAAREPDIRTAADIITEKDAQDDREDEEAVRKALEEPGSVPWRIRD